MSVSSALAEFFKTERPKGTLAGLLFDLFPQSWQGGLDMLSSCDDGFPSCVGLPPEVGESPLDIARAVLAAMEAVPVLV